MIPYGRQDVIEEDIEAVCEVLRSDYLTQGPKVGEFERLLCDKFGSRYGVAVSNATASLHIACLALGLSSGDILWTSPITFVASANCGLYCGAEVDFVDIDPVSFNICPKKLQQKLNESCKLNKLPKILVVVHLAGQSANMNIIKNLCDKYNVKIIEDASHAIGGKFNGRYIGSCHFSDVTVFSFHPVKIVTTGEGGIALTNDKEIARQMQLLRSHGITRDGEEMIGIPTGPWYYEQQMLGMNYRMTDIQAALGISQFKRLDSYILKRNSIAEYYNTKLQGIGLSTPYIASNVYSSYHLYIITLGDDILNKVGHRKIFERLRARDIGVNLHYMPVHLQPYFAKLGFKPGDFKISEAYASSAISLPIFPTLNRFDQDKVILALKEAIK